MYSRVIVGTDGSETATAAVERAAAIARLSGGELVALHAYRTTPAFGDTGGASIATVDPGILEDEGGRVLARLEERLGADVQFRTTLRRGDPARCLLDAAREEGADLIVIGSRGMKGARRVLGSVPNSVAHGAECDVLIVHTT